MNTEREAPRRPDLRSAVDRLGFRELVTLLTVAETGSFRRAGQRLSVGQSAISRRIQHIEDLLGVSLFERRASGARLTPAGSRFAYRARTILAELNFALEGAKSAAIGDAGRLSVGVAA
ncbi:LysR family transcriptional regulator [uncultured Roseobacter sp.]|uniref:LysR family transcriptional regulator n=1 Tax=uncultured Roseobacter sp. TaxID=114847 RepID=UPI0034543559